ncbi:MAG TPA: DUF2147 domain-containing protein [Solimonas sp.]|jgi:uncharacterized protein (DUF2147 family)|nr:DUF2147 domain-containing protein [Solimonas sp.]
MRSALLCCGAALLIAAGMPASAAGETPLGRWLAPDAAQHTVSTIELYLEGNELAGRVVEVVDRDGRPLAGICARCPDELRGRPIAGMRFLWGLHEKDGRWTGGKVIDLRDGLTQGVIANADLEIDGDRLTLHAYLGVRALGQSRTWRRAGVAAVDAPR